ncbi:hypothetical protein FGRMN_7263 [Fusarium graminum]|nr:hypothetical protein FGRMN_7263 [Fusarium graminum]
MNSDSSRIDALINYDAQELERVQSFNNSLILACSRRAIQKWAKAGTGHITRLDFSEMPQDIQSCVFVNKIAKEEYARLSRILAKLREIKNDIPVVAWPIDQQAR